MEPLETRLNALEQQLCTLNRRLRWWRGVACGLVGLALLTWTLPAGTAEEHTVAGHKKKKHLETRVAALEDLLKHFSRDGDEVFITGANLNLVNGVGSTNCFDEEQDEEIPDCPNGLGNVIVGYNEPRPEGFHNIRTGSHNLVVGQQHNFSRIGGLVVGHFNEISGDFAVVSGGSRNTASSTWSAVSGGNFNTASGEFAAVSGGRFNTASRLYASVSGGLRNTASGLLAVVSGGGHNTASGRLSAVSGGGNESIESEQPGNEASGWLSVVSGGNQNTASGDFASVSGGRHRTAGGEFNWVAGSLVEDE